MARKYQEKRTHLETVLKGSQVRKQELRVKSPTLYDSFEEIRNLWERHMVKGLPKNYIFQLLPCYHNGCPHPVCLSGKPLEEKCWYEGGPLLSYLPIPVPDPNRLWKGSACKTCQGDCFDHFLPPDEHLQHYNKHKEINFMKVPPREYLGNAFKAGKYDVGELVKTCLLPEDEVEIWKNICSLYQIDVKQVQRRQQRKG